MLCSNLTFSQGENDIKKINEKKIAPSLKLNQKSKVKSNFFVKTNENFNLKDWINKNKLSLNIESTIYPNIYLFKDIDFETISKLSRESFVRYIDAANRIAVEERSMEFNDMTMNNIYAVHVLYPEINGENLTVSIKENIFDINDIDFTGRIKNTEFGSEILSLHATMMTSLVAGGGNSSPSGRGIAWQANIAASDFSNLYPDDIINLKLDEVSVQNHSYGVNLIENYYGLEAQQYDLQCKQNRELVHVFSSGNRGNVISSSGVYSGVDGFASLTGQFKTSKNTICVGEIDGFGNIKHVSSKGPTFDGRVKPELVAFGYKGSSESAAMVSGVCLLIQDAYKNIHGELPASSLVKSILINSADDVGRPNVDFESGYGNVDALGAIETVQEGNFFTDTIEENEIINFDINVPINTSKLKITLVWTDVDGEAGCEVALVNNLNMELEEAISGNTWEPWILNHDNNVNALSQDAIRGVDSLNNVEQISILNPNSGDYSIRVEGIKVQSNQEFFISYEFVNESMWLYPIKGNRLEGNNNIELRWQWINNEVKGILEYKFINDTEWSLISDTVDLHKNFYSWRLPDTTELIQFRVKYEGIEIVSDTILISTVHNVNVGMNCEYESLIYWSSNLMADSYNIYRLENNFMKLYLNTLDTFLLINDTNKDYYNYAISPIFIGYEGLKSKTLNYTTQNVDCYFISFVPKYAVSDSVLLNLKLASNYRLQALYFERKDNDTYEIIQKIDPVNETSYILEDRNPKANRNIYRIKLERDDFKEIISQEESVYFSKVGSILIFPNPVSVNQELNIIDGEDGESTIRIVDGSGRVYYKGETYMGMVKGIPMSQFSPGIYFVELISSEGYRKVKKIIVL